MQLSNAARSASDELSFGSKRASSTLVVICFIASSLALAPISWGTEMTVAIDATPADLDAFFKRDPYLVLTFVGYSATEYEDKPAMLSAAAAILDQYPAATTIVNIGATPDGIGAIYEIAKRRGYATSGIVSSKAKEQGVKTSPFVDRIFYVKDETWGGVLPETQSLSPTSAAMVEYSDVMVAIGGGDIGRDEMRAAKAAGKRVRFIPADMNHGIAIEKATKAGRAAPTDFGSPVGSVLTSERCNGASGRYR